MKVKIDETNFTIQTTIKYRFRIVDTIQNHMP